MIVDWMVYAVAVAALLGLAGLAAERALRHAGRPGRWVWLAALAVSVLVPVLERLMPGSVTASFVALAPDVIPLPAIGAATEAAPGSPVSVGDVALVAWVAASLGLLLYTTLGALALRRRRATWRPSEVEGVRVLVSKDAGPAALGVLRGAVVVPEWALALEPSRRRMLVRHEAEHVRAWDPATQLAGLLLAMAFPWNPVVWWLLARLRLAIEVDCDARVLRGEHDARAYGTLLLEMGRHRSGLRLAAVSLAEPASMLERRIRMIGRPLTRNLWKAGALAALSGVAVVLACEAPSPSQRTVVEPGAEGAVGGVDIQRVPGDEACNPAVFVNGRDIGGWQVLTARLAVVARLEVEEDARATVDEDRGIVTLEPLCGTIRVTMREGHEADLTNVQEISEGEAAGRRQFEQQRDQAGGDPTEIAEQPKPSDGPYFTPFTTRPELVNAEEVKVALENNYPPLLRDAGIGGIVNVWFYIDEQGRVARTQINQGSGYDALDQAALRVADVLRFSPARNKDEVVPVWVSIPIVFRTDGAAEGG